MDVYTYSCRWFEHAYMHMFSGIDIHMLIHVNAVRSVYLCALWYIYSYIQTCICLLIVHMHVHMRVLMRTLSSTWAHADHVLLIFVHIYSQSMYTWVCASALKCMLMHSSMHTLIYAFLWFAYKCTLVHMYAHSCRYTPICEMGDTEVGFKEFHGDTLICRRMSTYVASVVVLAYVVEHWNAYALIRKVFWDGQTWF